MVDRAFAEFLDTLPPDLRAPLVARRTGTEAVLEESRKTARAVTALLADKEAEKTMKAAVIIGFFLSAVPGFLLFAVFGAAVGWTGFFVSLVAMLAWASHMTGKEKRKILAGSEPS